VFRGIAGPVIRQGLLQQVGAGSILKRNQTHNPMVTLNNDSVWRDGSKIGYCENNRFFDAGGTEVGYYEGTRIYDEGGYEKGYVENNQVYRSDGNIFDSVERVREHFSSGNYSEMPCAAVGLLFGWD
jgi:hypothetical protein